MKTILITGATGNVGKEVIHSLLSLSKEALIVAGLRDVENDSKVFSGTPIQFQHFDFEDENTFRPAFANCNILFLLRPPQISNVKKYFVPLIKAAQESHVEHIVFLSVQGVENSKIIPHHKIEKLIVDSAIPYTFLRPAYFMQNFTTTLRNDVVQRHQIFLPAGRAKFTIIDTSDIGLVAAVVLLNTNRHKNKSYELTSNEKLTFAQMAQKISEGIGKNIIYQSPNLLRFFIQKREENVPAMFILVMIMLHYFPRFQKEPRATDCVKKLTDKEPKTFDEFISENKALLCS